MVDIYLPMISQVAPQIRVLLLILDSARCHLTPEVYDNSNKLGIRLIVVPKGCTADVQVMDVGVIHPVRIKVAQLCDEFEHTLTVDAPPIPEKAWRKLVAEWVSQAVRSISPKTIQHTA